MPVHLQREIGKLKQMILRLGARVEESVRQAIEALDARDRVLAVRVIDSDAQIDQMEIEVEEECLKVLALHQPVAIDLRFIIAVLKINNDLERIGDLALNVAERAVFLSAKDRVQIPFDFAGMARKTQVMLREALNALVNMDAKTAFWVCKADDEVDEIDRAMYAQVEQGIRRQPEHTEAFINLLGVSRQLERIADHATNIAEDVIYMIKGEIVRHHVGEYGLGSADDRH